MTKKQIAEEFTEWITKEAPDFFEHFCKQSEYNKTTYWEYLECTNYCNYICDAFDWSDTPNFNKWSRLSEKWRSHIANLEKRELSPKIKIGGVEFSQETVENIVKEHLKNIKWEEQ
ncbi:MAG TPA: hypothetical protein DHM44_03855 [Flexistipes sinusarabici]|uniref:Uncharacterized protein n=1 Tax=Flexistipes sinusarabici TaxID=2352 RepID=A0A3D5QAD9_FLESI|nr:hypothetical protein [Flexistipes sinusarabici]